MASIKSNINLKDFNNLCRTCMNNCDVKYSRDHVISNIFYKLTEIHFETNDELPQQICFKCFQKINEIKEFSFQCQHAHFNLLKCLNKLKNPGIKAELKLLEETNEQLKTEDEIAIVEHEFVVVKDEILHSGSEYVIDELKLEKDEKTVSEENIIPEISNVQNVSYSKDDISETNVSDTEQNEEETNDSVNINDSSNSDDSYVVPEKKNKKKIENTKKEQYKCNVCNKIFISSTCFQKHTSLQTCERSYECEQCSKKFNELFNLKRHIRTHTSERPFNCNLCSNTFTRRDSLKDHMFTHTSERPYKCEICSKTFLNAYVLKTHMRSHTGERPFKCKLCSNTFTHRYTLKSHMLTHTGEIRYQCDICLKTLAHGASLKRHLRVHTGERPYKCK